MLPSALAAFSAGQSVAGLAYLFVSILCWKAYRAAGRTPGAATFGIFLQAIGRGIRRRERPLPEELTGGLWFLLASLFLLLSIFRICDLQEPILASLRRIAREGEWYDARRGFQISAILIFGGLGVGALFLVTKLGRGQTGRLRFALSMSILLMGWMALRSLSFHPVDRLIYSSPTAHALSGALEVGATLLVALVLAARGRVGSVPS